MSRARQRADRIHNEIPISQVLSDYGYAIHSGYDGEQQFSCDLHGDGTDNKPSARVYPESASWYCFACDRTRDAIQTVREKEGLDFWGAVKALEQRYGLSRMEYEEEAESQRPPAQGVVEEVEDRTSTTKATTWEDEHRRTWKFLDGLTVDKVLPLPTLLKLWEAHDKVSYLVQKGGLPEEKGKEAIEKVLNRAKELLRGTPA